MSELTSKDFYDTMTKLERNINTQFSEIKKDMGAISREVGEVTSISNANSQDIETNSLNIKYLERRDRGIMAIASGIGGAIGTAGAYVLSIIKGGP